MKVHTPFWFETSDSIQLIKTEGHLIEMSYNHNLSADKIMKARECEHTFLSRDEALVTPRKFGFTDACNGTLTLAEFLNNPICAKKDDIFFTPTVQLKSHKIESVSVRTIGKPCVRVNTHNFKGENAKIALESLYKCGFYSAEQYKVVSITYEDLCKEWEK